MIYAEILAGGIGSRMGNVNMPKQFLKLGNKPIIIHTIEKFVLNNRFDKIFIVVHPEWLVHAKNLLKTYGLTDERLMILSGGTDRSESLLAGPRYLQAEGLLTAEDVIITHDSVRPFITHRIIEDNIDSVLKYDAVDTVIGAIDTIVASEDGEFIQSIPNRDHMYQGQTPQSFNVAKLVRLFDDLSEDAKAILSDGCKVFILSGEKVKLVEGEVSNIKVTNPYDFNVANHMIEGDKDDQPSL
ncbi:IspD/TarI family cytidylyltransferase [Brochothrix campestris]|uniref:Ribitol-5-phosphate cytidylyltransferase n=1 Tax=Brochothrix campestris FSL F6-1037 TaxID=1265861 RepID=W7CX49_9LIST|nr:2-C-methyl-D-erythritol 4-phosphate cytidylyltransferase [Brochothrix campestris]EUJ37628.1 2-C-methyl-D-erythritol 4-phosphate cytidylyltransferase [Brochothrix campestris FSL F6-1037]